MQAVSIEQVHDSLKALKIAAGDGLLVHSAVQFLGRPVGGLKMYLDAIFEVIGARGTLVVPTFNFGFARTRRYDPFETPSQADMGVFSEYVRKLPEARRSSHPLQSIAAIGQYADDLTSRDTPSAFDPGSAFERMLQLDFKLLLLGADERAISMLHYCEQRAQVPYRYWKEFPGEVRTPKGWQHRSYRMFVRDLDLNPQLTLVPVVQALQKIGAWHTVNLNYGKITTCLLRVFVQTTDQILKKDPWALVTNLEKS